MNLDGREKYENWFRATYGQAPMPRTSPVHDFCWAGYKAGAASRDAEVNDWRSQAHQSQSLAERNEAERDQLSKDLSKELFDLDTSEMNLDAAITENDQLREHVKTLREALERIIRQQETIGQKGNSAWTTADFALTATEPKL